jgi:methylthioribose-1-phosphate isomerase
MSLEAIVYKDGKLEILDQLLIPAESKYMKILTLKAAFNAIKDMNVSVFLLKFYLMNQKTR